MFASHEPRTGAADLPRTAMPADHGLGSLGLVMQLAGRTTGVLAALIASIVLVDHRYGRYGSIHLTAWFWPWFWFVLALSFARSQFHRIAGRDLTYSRHTAEGVLADPFDATRSYTIFGIGHAIVLGLVAALVLDEPPSAAAGITGALALWPCVLAVVCRLPRFRPFRAGIPLGEDRGLEGASIVVTVLGACGVLSTGAILVLLGTLSPHQLRHGWGVMLVMIFGVLVVRSSLNVRAGLTGLGDSSFDRPGELVARYATFAVVSAFCVIGALSLLAMSERLTLDAVAGLAVVGWLLVTWPMIVKRFFTQRQFAELLAGDRVRHRRAPDAGLTSLGWLMAGHATLVAGLLLAGSTVHLGHALGNAWTLGGGLAGPYLYLRAVVLALELATAVALLRMSDNRRAIATIYALVAGGVALALAVPVLGTVGRSPDPWLAIRLLLLAVQLVLPAAALLLARRQVVPAARARYRRPAPQAEAAEPLGMR